MKEIYLSLLLSSILAYIAFLKKSMTIPALILSWIFAVIITCSGGISAFTILSATFTGTVISDKLFKNKKINVEKNIIKKSHKKDIIQILCNVGIPTFSLIIYFYTKNEIFLITYSCVMATSLADSASSSFGILSKKKPLDICTFKSTSKGLSGGITSIGICFSLLGALIIGFSFFIFDMKIITLVFITVMGFFGSIIDSILGSLFQVKYICSKCNIITEKERHCNKKTSYFKGISFINNDIVNILNNIFIFIISVVLQIIF